MPTLEEPSRNRVSARLPARVGDSATETGLTRINATIPQENVSGSCESTDGSMRDFYLSDEWNLACRVAASKGLSKSSLLPRFLLHICEQHLRGNAHQLSEQRIGAAIFNRAPDYNPGEDNIVRSYARTLRRRLDEYFAAEGRHESVRIAIPRGGYVPTFERNTPEPSALPNTPTLSMEDNRPPMPSSGLAVSDEATEAPPIPGPRPVWITPLCSFLAGLFLAGVGFGVHERREKRPMSSAHPIWTELFQANRNTLIVPADSGIGILQNLSGHLVSLEEYANGSYFPDTHLIPGVDASNLADLRQQRYTSLVDLNITARIIQLPECSTGRTEIRFARSLTTEDLKSSNVILLGSTHSNPWVALFEGQLNFRLQYMPTVDQSFVLNERPEGTEQKQYFNGTGLPDNQTYGVIDYLPNLDGSGHVLIIQGLNMAATQAAADTLFNTNAMEPVLKKARRPDGSLRPFELLVKTSSIGATAPDLQVIAARFHA